jgi:hypothetical protein
VNLRKLPKNEAFYFFTSIGNYTGKSASSLEEFVKKIKEMNIESLKFHFYRGDFENWIIGTLGDEKLGEKIKNLRSQRLSERALRNQLYSIVLRQYANLKQEHFEKLR